MKPVYGLDNIIDPLALSAMEHDVVGGQQDVVVNARTLAKLINHYRLNNGMCENFYINEMLQIPSRIL